MKLWQKNTGVAAEIEKFTVGKDPELDMQLARFDVLGSLAHIRMLQSIDLLTKEELEVLEAELKVIYHRIAAGDFAIEPGVEDIHSQVELELTRKVGEAGKKIHSGRSRNDQVLVDLKLFFRHQLQETVEEVKALFDVLQQQSEKYKHVLLPGYTHLQVAMPSSFGLWFGAYAESLVDDMHLLQAAYKIADKNPLGSAAGYGSSFPLNRQMTTDLLGFEAMSYNVVYAQMGRGKTERVVATALASVAATLAKMAMDLCLYMNQNFAFVTLPDSLTTGSSIMPHKKNPDVFELLRGKCNKLQALSTEISMLLINLPSGYHRDLQLLKENLFPAFEELQNCLQMMAFMMEQLQVRENILQDEKYQYLFSVDAVNALVLEGMPFRDAYKVVGESIEAGTFAPPAAVTHTHEGSIGNLCNEQIALLMEQALKGFNFERAEAAFKNLLKEQ
ncbi:argininosuccinate lyase [Pontibacter ummariensis]|uniref:Argininosuccinate lyase n=1 Tax=Pontibacter ummariensis TaxID=1610492 RepID=A0A239BWX3_9BACT|nr:argininosuccinate lyase [Pontibacter ummariensis]PRY15612.1 argininosuccinate lyase [Pontibacter ummariensis]SNS11564.1 argininosuccinate lyase [Pontibacter ummariensis]